MKIKQSTVLSTVTSSPSITTQEAGMLPGMQVLAQLTSPAGNFAGSGIIQTSVDGTTWATAAGAVAVTAGGVVNQVITLAQFVRLNVTVVSAGALQLTLLSDID